MQKNEDCLQTTIEKCLGNIQNFEEDDSNSRESLSMAEYAYYYLYCGIVTFHLTVITQRNQENSISYYQSCS